MWRLVFGSWLVVAAASCGYEEIAPKEQAQIERIGHTIVVQIEAFKKSHGRYPASLQEAHIRNVPTSIGLFRYELQSPACFALSIGDFAKQGVNLVWNSCIDPPRWLVEE